jgi:hypothetical protein
MYSQKPILVTGSHRSGSTWVGRMIALSPLVGYIQEPFNLAHRPGICSAQFDYWFPYITAQNEAQFYQGIQKTMEFSYSFGAEVKALQSMRDLLRMVRDSHNFWRYQIIGARPLIKDPIALFSAEWLASRFDMSVVAVIRHPAAFVSSLKRKNWTFPFEHLVNQPLLLQEQLYPFADEIRDYAIHPRDIVDQASLLWTLIHHVIGLYQQRHPDWLFVRHEDLSSHPVEGFQQLFRGLNLEFSGPVQRGIEDHTSAENPSEATRDKRLIDLVRREHLKRDSQSNISNWKNKLSPDEIHRIRTKTEAVSSLFYRDSDW